MDANASKAVKRLVEQGRFEEALAEIKDAPFEDWRNFRRKVLEVAKKELEESEYSEICFDYEPVKSGKGGKVTGIRFFVKKNPKCIHHSDLQRMPSGEEEGEENAPNVLAAKKTPVNEKLILEVADIFGNEPITIQEIKVLLQVSDNLLSCNRSRHTSIIWSDGSENVSKKSGMRTKKYPSSKERRWKKRR